MIHNGDIKMMTFQETKCYFIYEMTGDAWNEKKEYFSKKELDIMNRVVNEMTDEQGEKWFKNLSSQFQLYLISKEFWKIDNTSLRYAKRSKDKPSFNDIKLALEIKNYNEKIKGLDFDTLVEICINFIYLLVVPIVFFFIGRVFNLYEFIYIYILMSAVAVVGVTIGMFTTRNKGNTKEDILDAVAEIRQPVLISSLLIGGVSSFISLFIGI